MEQRKIGIGVMLLAVSGAVLFLTGGINTTFRLALLLWAAVGLAMGFVLIGTAESGRPA